MRSIVFVVFTLVLVPFSFGQTPTVDFPVSGQPLASGTPPSGVVPDYHIGPDDLVDITVFEVPDLDTSVRVTATGFVSLPLLGVIAAAGRTPSELEAEISTALRDGFVNDPHVTVFVQEYGSQPVSILGAVAEPGIYQIRGRKYLLDMLAMAGGLNETAGKIIQIIRRSSNEVVPGLRNPSEPEPDAETIEINVEDLFLRGRTELNVAVQAGDVISVTQAGSIFVVGEVNGPGEFVLRNGRNVTVTQALALSAGFSRDAKKTESTIIRLHPDGTREEIPVDLDKVMQNEADDVAMLPNDILFVPASRAKAGLAKALDTTLAIATGRLIYR